MALAFTRVETDAQRHLLADTANAIWHEFFPGILSSGQIDYMVEKFQSYPAMKRQMEEEHYEYYLLYAGNTLVGYTGIREDGEKLFLSKLYLKKEHRGKGYASEAFAFLESLCKERGLCAIWLTVNRHNEHTIAVYRAKGFVPLRTQVSDIGNGYVMDDYVMEKAVE